jgi:phosphoglycolate phosphatase-like HAD superfamily hydrolase
VTFRRHQGAVLFDLDGVLVDSRAAVAGCINYALRTHGLAEQPEERLHRFIGPPLAIAFSERTARPPESAMRFERQSAGCLRRPPARDEQEGE